MKKNILCMTPLKPFVELDEMEKYGNVIYEPDISKSELQRLLIAENIDFIFTNPNKQGYMLDSDALAGTSVSLINTCSTGTNHIDLEYCASNGIEIWSLAKDFELINQLPSTSELAFGLMLCLIRKIPDAFDSASRKEWNYTGFIGRQVKGLSIGIVGFGRLGKIMANFCVAFGAKVFIYDPYERVPNSSAGELEQCENLYDLLSRCDVVSLHVHVVDETRHMVGVEFLEEMKAQSYLVNTARGEIVDENAVVGALRSGNLGGYATDVVSDEFGDLNESPILKGIDEGLNLIVTPHIGGMTLEGPRLTYKWAIRKFGKIL